VGELPEQLDCAPPSAPDGYERLIEDRLGFAGLLALRVAHGQSGADAYAWAGQWRADDVTSYASIDDEAKLAIAWRIRLGSPAAAQELSAALGGTDGLQASAADREVLVRAASDADLLTGWPDPDDCARLDDKARVTGQPSPLLTALRRRLKPLR
jgi:hypothetical protein